jgi:hypothetical protein
MQALPGCPVVAEHQGLPFELHLSGFIQQAPAVRRIRRRHQDGDFLRRRRVAGLVQVDRFRARGMQRSGGRNEREKS